MAMTIPEIKRLLDAADENELDSLKRALAADTRKGVAAAIRAAEKRISAEGEERRRIEGLYSFEDGLHAGSGLIVGLDEVGRGSVAGPLAVGAVVLDRDSFIAGLDDSKKIKPERRAEIAASIKERAIAWTVAYIPPADIDRNGMSYSLKSAFSQAIEKIDSVVDGVDLVLIDGNPLHIDEREFNVVKGDAKCASIAAASIIAKTERDALMIALSKDYPEYQFDVNKGYASPQHIEAIKRCGLSTVHRESFCRSFLQQTLF